MDTLLNNIRIAELKIQKCISENDDAGVKLWKEVAQKEIARLSSYFKEIDRPLSVLAQLYKN
jgi:hypothetical protein